MDDVTRTELREIREQLEEVQRGLVQLEGLAEGIFRSISKKGRSEWMKWWHSSDAEDYRRLQRGTTIFDAWNTSDGPIPVFRLVDADLLTLEEIAAKGRREVASTRGVGRVSLKRLDAALSERGLSWAVAS